MKVSTLRIAPREIIHFFIANDWHFTELDIDAYSILKQQAKSMPKSRLIINGDFLDMWYLMKKHPLYQRWINRKDCMDEFFIPNYEKEIAWGNFILNELCKIFESIYFIFGNHDGTRLDEFLACECDKRYKDCMNIERDLKLRERGIGCIKCNDYLDISNVSITHGMKEGKSALNQHYLSSSNNTIIGHLHKHELLAFDSRGQAKFALSLPAMSKRPDHERMLYMKNKDNRWSIGYGILHTDGPENSFIDVCHVREGKMIIGRDVYYAQKEELGSKEF